MSANPLAAGSLAGHMASSLPKSSGIQLRNGYDVIALLSHACMLSVGFRLIGLGEDHTIEISAEDNAAKPLPPEWNASSTYSFRYGHSQSAMEYVVKVNRLGPKAVVMGLGVGADKTTSFDVAVKDYVSDSSLPFNYPPEGEPGDELWTQMQALFHSPGRVADFGALFKLNVIQKLIPSLHKEGYEESQAPREGQHSSSSQQPARDQREPGYDPLRDDRGPPPVRPYPLADPLVGAPRHPYPAGDFPPPGFEDEYEINRPPRGAPPGFGGRNPFGIGHDDLYPPGLGPHDPLRGSFGPGLGGGGGGLPRPGGGGGMHPTFDDPLFGGRGGEGVEDPRRPAGARYDPVGPGDEPFGQGGPRFPGSGGGRGGPPNPFGGLGGGPFI